MWQKGANIRVVNKEFNMDFSKQLKQFFDLNSLNSKEADLLIKQAEKFDRLYKVTRFLAAMGTPIKSSRDFERSLFRVLSQVNLAIFSIDSQADVGNPAEMSDKEIEEAKLIAKKVAIRPFWLDKELKEKE